MIKNVKQFLMFVIYTLISVKTKKHFLTILQIILNNRRCEIKEFIWVDEFIIMEQKCTIFWIAQSRTLGAFELLVRMD